jgi:large subunit ribosomal protein L4e
LVQVHSADKAEVVKQVVLPAVFTAPIRPDVVHFVHANIAKNHRQPYAVYNKAGMQYSAESWGTGRAVARIPRVSGGGTHRSGQGAFGNMCRGGRMFAPTQIWRKWHRKINVNQRRYAIASALAASAVPALVMARGHRVSEIAEIPLVINDSLESVSKTSAAVALLKRFNAYADVEKVKGSRKIRRGKGKLRNRRHVQRRGPLVIYNKDQGVTKAFRNIPGVEVVSVDRLNILQLAPGGHLGRFIIWSESAFKKLEQLFGSYHKKSTLKRDYHLPRAHMTNADVSRLINSDEVQSVVRPAFKRRNLVILKKNPLRNFGFMVKLNPAALIERRRAILSSRSNEKKNAARREEARKGIKKTTKKTGASTKKAHKAVGRKFYKTISA